jgi:hypothetical protein
MILTDHNGAVYHVSQNSLRLCDQGHHIFFVIT